MIVFKTIFAFFFLMILTRILGKKQMGEMTYFNYITGITLGTLTANIISTDNQSNLDEIFGLLIWGGLVFLIGYLSLKIPKIREVVEGKPTLLVKDGKISKDALKSSKLTLDELMMLLRNNSIFSIKDVDYVILETNGKISILKEQNQLNITKEDMNIDTASITYLPSQLISDGRVLESNLQELGLNRDWLQGQIKKLNIDKIEEIFYAEIQGNGELYIEQSPDKN